MTRSARGARLIGTAVVVVVLSGAWGAAAGIAAPAGGSNQPALPEVSKPVHGGKYGVPYNPAPKALLERYGYTEREYLVTGEASSYVPTGPLGADGMWSVEPGGSAGFTTRVIVRRPRDAAGFNGTFVIEWLNVSAGRDADPDFGFLHPLLMSQGYGYVGVTAQEAGIEAGGAVLEVPGVPEVALLPLTEWDPQRYASLEHPGDAYSYDIFHQGARAGVEASGLEAEDVIAVGESQSAIRLATYVNAVQPITGYFDGILIHSRGDGVAALAPDTAFVNDAIRIRTDLDIPVLQIETETDLVFLQFVGARQPDTDSLRTWEIAGTAHADSSQLEYGAESAQVWYDGPAVDFEELCGPINTGPQAEVTRAGLMALRRWVRDGEAPSEAPPIETTADGAIVRDELGNARGGIRTPDVDAPTLSLSGQGSPNSVFCSLFGTRAPLSPEQLAGLYPDHDAYVAAVRRSADAAADAGFLLRSDARRFVRAARRADVP